MCGCSWLTFTKTSSGCNDAKQTLRVDVHTILARILLKRYRKYIKQPCIWNYMRLQIVELRASIDVTNGAAFGATSQLAKNQRKSSQDASEAGRLLGTV